MDARRFDALARALTQIGTRRSALGWLAATPVAGGLLALLDPDTAVGRGRRKRRKKRHKHGKGHRRQHATPCKPHPKATTCAGAKCGLVTNNCKKTVDCGSCDCTAPCGVCEICQAGPNTPGACVPDPDKIGDACGAATCSGGEFTSTPTCSASGVCQPGAPVSCAPYARCDGTACATSCGSMADCLDGYFCDQVNHCVSERGDGQPCAIDEECDSGFCVNQICCDTACDRPCEVCDASGNVGTCTITVGAACGGSATCTAGQVTPAPICQPNGQCQSGPPVSCAPYSTCAGNACASVCASDGDCVAGAFCNAGQCEADYANGTTCDRDAQCQSGHCVENVCCSSACNTACNTCASSSPSYRGRCIPKPSGTACGSGGTCCCGTCQAGQTCGTGSSFCAPCTRNADCASGLCGCPASDCAGGGICVERYDDNITGCIGAGGDALLVINPSGGSQRACAKRASGDCQTTPCPAGQACHLTRQFCVTVLDVPPAG